MKKIWLKGISLILVLLLAVTPMIHVQADKEETLVYNLFQSSGFTAECAKVFTTDGNKGLVFSGVAPASFSTANRVTGDFIMDFSSVTEESELEFISNTGKITASFFSTSSAVTITVGENSGVLEMGYYDIIRVELSADDQKLYFSARGKTVEFTVDGMDYVDYGITYRALENYMGEVKVCVYCINGSSFNAPVLRNTTQQIYMPITSDGVRGNDYELQQPFLYDLIEGKNSAVTVAVTKDGKTVMDAKLWEPRMRFPAATSGFYTVILTSVENDTVIKEYQIEVRDKVSESELVITEEFPFETVGVGSVVTMPTVMLRNDLFGDELQQTQYTVSYNGEVVTAVVGQEEKTFCFEKAGQYRFDYYSVSAYFNDRYSFTVNVVDSMPAITYIWDAGSSAVGQKYQLPSAQMVIDGRQLQVNTILHFPDGKAVSNDVMLSQGGVYQVEFRAEDNGQIYRYFAKLKVDDYLHKTANNVTYGAWTEGYFDEPVSGLMVELTDGEIYEYGNIIDLSDNNSDYATFMKFYVLPYTKGTADFTGMQITLTDAYDESKYVLLDFIHSDGVGDAYVRMRASNQSEMIGMQWWSDDRIVIHRNNAYGYHGLVSFKGDQSASYPGSYTKMEFSLGYDTSEQIVYGTHAWRSSGEVGLSKVMSRLASTDVYREAFEGFTTGEVRLSIRAYNFNGSKGRLFITNIDDQDLTKTVVTDTDAPRITVNTLEYSDENIPQAIVGQAYPVFDAEAMDAQCGELPLNVRVCYLSEHRAYDVSVKDGAFVPQWEGDYKIQYSTEDFYGNEALREVLVHAGSEIPVTVSYDEHTETAFTGQNIPTADWNSTGGHGTVMLKSIKAVHSSGDETEIKDGYFTPTASGAYRICYVFEDYLGNNTQAEYTLTVTDCKDPIVNDDPVLPMAVMDGGVYRLPRLTAADYASGKYQEVAAKIFVEDAAGKRLLENGEYQASGDKGSVATVSYEFKTATGELTKQYHIPIGNLKTAEEKMFDLAGMIISESCETVIFDGKENYYVSAKEDGQFLFARELLASGFDLKFNIGHQAEGTFQGGDLDTIRLTLVDMEKPEDRIYIDVSRRDDVANSSYISINGGTKFAMNGSFNGNTNYPFEINYNGETKAITAGSVLAVDVETYADGREFAGFQSEKLYCIVDFVGVGNTGALMELISVSGQPFNHGPIRDRIAPSYALTAPMSVCYAMGDIVKLPNVVVSDVLSMNAHIKVSVQTPTREYVTAEDGTRLEMVDTNAYEIKLDQMGTYLVNFSVWDDNGAPITTISRSIVVMDNTAPVLTAEKDKLKATVGKATAINIFKATDDDGQEVTLRLFIQNAAGKLIAVDGESYTFEKAGFYQLVAVAYDTLGNMTRMQIPIEVGGA